MPKRRVPRRYRKAVEHFVAGHEVRLLKDGAAAFPEMLAAIDAAQRQVLLEMYWFDSGRIGRGFADALGRAARRGVEVAVIYDSLGSLEAEEDMFDGLREAGARVLEFNPLAPWHQRFRIERLTRRDHRKMLVVDESLGFTGGVNISDLWLPTDEGGAGWRDDVLVLRGPAVRRLARCFNATWAEETGRPLQRATAIPPPANGTQRVRVLDNTAGGHRRQIVRAYLYQIYRAHRRIWISNSYFVPDARILRALVFASLRGVDVRVLVPGKTDVEVVRLASQAMYPKLLAAGVRIFEWQGNVLHSKTAVIDGEWSTIGSFNLDYRSLRGNLELNVAVLDPGFGKVMEESFLADLEKSEEVRAAAVEQRGAAGKLLSSVLYRFRGLL